MSRWTNNIVPSRMNFFKNEVSVTTWTFFPFESLFLEYWESYLNCLTFTLKFFLFCFYSIANCEERFRKYRDEILSYICTDFLKLFWRERCLFSVCLTKFGRMMYHYKKLLCNRLDGDWGEKAPIFFKYTLQTAIFTHRRQGVLSVKGIDPYINPYPFRLSKFYSCYSRVGHSWEMFENWLCWFQLVPFRMLESWGQARRISCDIHWDNIHYRKY